MSRNMYLKMSLHRFTKEDLQKSDSVNNVGIWLEIVELIRSMRNSALSNLLTYLITFSINSVYDMIMSQCLLFINRMRGPYREILSPRFLSTDRACEVRA